ncbi:MAG: lipid A deacylase LpxR family protein [Parvularculaceae bacterium]
MTMHMMSRLASASRCAFAAIAIAATTPAAAEPAPAVYAIVYENDVFAGSDRRYTSGIKHQFLSAEGRGRRLAAMLLRAGPGDDTRWGVGAGQSIFTPDDISAAAPLPGQQPYAGWLYVEATSVVVRESGAADILKIAAGVIGPWSLAEDTQRTLHRSFNFIDPAGWANQLGNEPAFVASFDRQWRPRRQGRGFGAEILPHAGVSAGTVLTEARLGATFRIGSNLDAAGAPARVAPSLPASGAFGGEGLAWQIFAGAQGRSVAHNIFLDGSTFRDSLSVEKNTFVGEFQA